jgi:hypothetical protein
MWTNTQEGRQVVDEISKQLVMQLAPEEIDLFDDLAREVYDHPAHEGSPPPQQDDALGFGAQEMVIALTPAVVGTVKTVLEYVLSESLETFKGESAAWVQARVKTLFKPASAVPDGAETGDSAAGEAASPAPGAALAGPGFSISKENLAKIQALAKKQARIHGLPPKEAQQMADALIGRLILST